MVNRIGGLVSGMDIDGLVQNDENTTSTIRQTISK